jgi:MOSC domain-containing protein YiiM
VEVDIVGITDPCRVMDEQYAGLRSALVPDARGGVYGRVVQGGEIRLGDSIVVLGCSPAEDRA